jgi:uncharacterized membrane protein YfbV (UPF0208 family)
MTPEQYLPAVVYAAAAMALCAAGAAWWIWRHAAPMPSNIVSFKDLRK